MSDNTTGAGGQAKKTVIESQSGERTGIPRGQYPANQSETRSSETHGKKPPSLSSSSSSSSSSTSAQVATERYQGFDDYTNSALQQILLATGLNDFAHDFGHEKTLSYLNCMNKYLGNATISSVEFERRRLLFAMGAGGATGNTLKLKVGRGQNINIDEKWKRKTVEEIGTKNDDIYNIYEGIKDNTGNELLTEKTKLSKNNYYLTNEINQISTVVGFKFNDLVTKLTPDIFKSNDLIAELDRLETTVQELGNFAIQGTGKQRNYKVHPVPVKALGRRIYLPGAIKRATGNNNKIVILIDASNLSMKSLGENFASIAGEYGPNQPIQILILMNNANLADSAMKISEEIQKDDNIKLTILFATEENETTNFYPNPNDNKSSINQQNKALFNNFWHNETTKEDKAKISANIIFFDTKKNEQDAVHIDDLGEESQISKVSAKIVLDYLESDGNLSTSSMVRGNTKKMGDSCQAISLLDLDRSYYYCDVYGRRTDENGVLLSSDSSNYNENTFTLNKLKQEGWVVYLLTHDKVLLSIGLLLGINVLYTIKLLFRDNESSLGSFGIRTNKTTAIVSKKNKDDEDSTSRSITWLLGFENINEPKFGLTKEQIIAAQQKEQAEQAKLLTEVNELNKTIPAKLEEIKNFFNENINNQGSIDKKLQLCYIYVDIYTKISNIYNRIPPPTSAASSSSSSSSSLSFFDIQKVKKDLAEVENIDFKIMINEMLTLSKNKQAAKKYNLTNIMQDIGFIEYKGILLRLTKKEIWNNYISKFQNAINDLDAAIKRKGISVFPSSFFKNLSAISAIPESSANPEIKEAYLYSLFNKLVQSTNGGMQNKKGGMQSSSSSSSSSSTTTLLSSSTVTINSCETLYNEIFEQMSQNSITLIRDNGALLRKFNRLSINGKFDYTNPSHSSSTAASLPSSQLSITKKDIYNILSYSINKPIYNAYSFLSTFPIQYCLDEEGKRYELTDKFSNNDDIYVDIPLIDSNTFNRIEELIYNNIHFCNDNRQPEEIMEFYYKIKIHYYETLIYQLLEEKKQYLKFIAINFFHDNGDIDTNEFFDDNITNINDIITEYSDNINITYQKLYLTDEPLGLEYLVSLPLQFQSSSSSSTTTTTTSSSSAGNVSIEYIENIIDTTIITSIIKLRNDLYNITKDNGISSMLHEIKANKNLYAIPHKNLKLLVNAIIIDESRALIATSGAGNLTQVYSQAGESESGSDREALLSLVSAHNNTNYTVNNEEQEIQNLLDLLHFDENFEQNARLAEVSINTGQQSGKFFTPTGTDGEESNDTTRFVSPGSQGTKGTSSSSITSTPMSTVKAEKSQAKTNTNTSTGTKLSFGMTPVKEEQKEEISNSNIGGARYKKTKKAHNKRKGKTQRHKKVKRKTQKKRI